MRLARRSADEAQELGNRLNELTAATVKAEEASKKHRTAMIGLTVALVVVGALTLLLPCILWGVPGILGG